MGKKKKTRREPNLFLMSFTVCLKIISLVNIVMYYLHLCSICVDFSSTYLETFHKDSDTRSRAATEACYAVVFAIFRLKKTGSFH